MSQRWLLRLCDPQGRRLQWMAQQGEPAEPQDGDFDQACAALGGQVVSLALPGSAVTLHHASLPATSRARLRAAAPYALEESLADDVEDLHFAVGERAADGRVPVAVVDREWLRGWLDGFAAAGLQVTRVIVEPLLLPEPETGYCVLLEGDWAIVRGPGSEGFGVEAEVLSELLLGEDGDTTVPVDVYHLSDQVPPTFPGLRHIEAVESALPLLRRGLANPRLDLLQGEFSPGEALGRSLKRWRVTAVLALLLMSVWAGNSWLDILRTEATAARLDAQVEQVLKQAIPDIRRVVNPRVQMRQRLQALQGQQADAAGFLDLLVEVGAALVADKSLTLTGISYRRGRLDLELEAGQIAALYRLQQKLAEKPSLAVNVQSANSEDGRARGRLRIEAKTG